MKDLLSTSQVAKKLNVHRNTIRRWADEGLINCYRLGPRKDRGFELKDVEDYLEKCLEKKLCT